jgi:hypothetical protein
MTIHIIKRASELSPDNSIFSLVGFSGEASPNNTSNIDFLFNQERWITGGTLLVKGGSWGDSLSIQVVDRDNILGYGPNLVLLQFISDFKVNPEAILQEKIEVSYVSLIAAGLVLRVKYNNTSTTEVVDVACNLFLHQPKG